MPYKSFDSFQRRVGEDCIRSWMAELNPRSVSYLFNFLQYYDWFRFEGRWKSAQEMIDEHAKLLDSPGRKERYKHVNVLKEYIKSKGTGKSDRRNTWSAVTNFYGHHRVPLPPVDAGELKRLFAVGELDKRRKTEIPHLKIEELRQVITSAPPVYRFGA